jgi:hypothetical protein
VPSVVSSLFSKSAQTVALATGTQILSNMHSSVKRDVGRLFVVSRCMRGETWDESEQSCADTSVMAALATTKIKPSKSGGHHGGHDWDDSEDWSHSSDHNHGHGKKNDSEGSDMVQYFIAALIMILVGAVILWVVYRFCWKKRHHTYTNNRYGIPSQNYKAVRTTMPMGEFAPARRYQH